MRSNIELQVIILSYDNWFSYQLISLIQAIESQKGPDDIKKIIDEINNGLAYVSANPNSINSLLVRMGEGLIGPVLRTYRFDTNSNPKKTDDINIDELKMALGKHQKDKIINKMSGSLSQLSELDDD